MAQGIVACLAFRSVHHYGEDQVAARGVGEVNLQAPVSLLVFLMRVGTWDEGWPHGGE